LTLYVVESIVEIMIMYLKHEMQCWDFIYLCIEDYYLMMRYYVWWLSSVANFYENQIMHVLEKCRCSI